MTKKTNQPKAVPIPFGLSPDGLEKFCNPDRIKFDFKEIKLRAYATPEHQVILDNALKKPKRKAKAVKRSTTYQPRRAK